MRGFVGVAAIAVELACAPKQPAIRQELCSEGIPTP